jgi:hypothetical protein
MFNGSARLEELLSRVVDGITSEEEMGELEGLLGASPEARRRYVHAMDLHAELQARGARSPQQDPPIEQTLKSPVFWFGWGNRAAMAAGIMLGAFGASLVFGAVSVGKIRGISVLRESFEHGPEPRVTGVPRESGVWSGDYCELATAQGDLLPAKGKKMLRFLRADYEGKPNPEGNRTSGIWRLVDVRAFGAEIREGNAEIQLSARLNATPSERDYAAFLSVYAWTANGWAQVNPQDWRAVDAKALAMSRGSWVEIDRDPATWQPLEAALRLPEKTEFVLIQAALKQVSAKEIPVEFGEQYLDNLRMTLWSRVPMQ